MSLVVWLPFTNGTLKQQGSSTSIPSGTAFTSNTEGKLGKCIKTTTSGYIDLGYNGNQINVGSITFGGWFKFNKAEIQSAVGSYSYNETRTTATGNLVGNNSYGGVALVWATNNLYTSNGVVNSIYVYSTLRSTQNGARSTSSKELAFDTWYNIYLIFNKATKMLQLWIDGELFRETAMTDFTDARDLNLRLNYNAIWGGNGPSFNIPFYVNDLRIYDEALGKKEIKRISQGLILHYKMNDDKLESTQNLITTEDCLSSTCYNAAISKYNYGTSTDIYKTVTTYDGKRGTKVYMGTSGNNCFPYVYVNNMYTSDGTNAPAYKTLSFDYYGTIGNYLGPYPLGKGGGTVNYVITCDGKETVGNYSGYGFFPITPNKWNHIQLTFHGTSTDNAQWGYIRIGNGNHVSDTSNFWFFANMQLEAKDHATGYAGVGGIRNSTKVWDSSGYNNDGIISGTLSIDTDTPKYKYSTIFSSGANYINAGRGAMVKDSITVNLWCKFSTWGNPISCTEGGGWNFENSNNSIRFPVYISGVGYKVAESNIAPGTLANAWHMLTGTFDKTNVKIYIDGELKNTIATDSTNGIGYNGGNVIFIGAEAAGSQTPASTSFIGKISDVRIYATALSPEDIKSLYQNCVTIDSDGVVRGQLRG